MTYAGDLARLEVVVAARFCGPPRSANGGYVAGRLAALLSPDDAVEVTLLRPPPLGVRLEVAFEQDAAALVFGEVSLARARRTPLDVAPPPPVAYDEAVEAATRYAGRRDHPFPTCFVCGPDRARGDGMRLQPGGVATHRVAAAWQPHPTLAATPGDTRQDVATQFVWAALDCPGGWATDLAGRPMVLGRMTARVIGVPYVGQSCVVVGEALRTEGRKAFTASALYTSDAELLACASAVWIAVDPHAVRPNGE